MNEEKMKRDPKVIETMTIEVFEAKLLEYNNTGRDLTLKHKELFPAPKVDEDGKKAEDPNYHAAGTNAECPHCQKIIEAHDNYMKLQLDCLELTGIPYENIMAAIKITKATIVMMGNSAAAIVNENAASALNLGK